MSKCRQGGEQKGWTEIQTTERGPVGAVRQPVTDWGTPQTE